MTVTFAVGWLKKELDLLGVPFHQREIMPAVYAFHATSPAGLSVALSFATGYPYLR